MIMHLVQLQAQEVKILVLLQDQGHILQFLLQIFQILVFKTIISVKILEILILIIAFSMNILYKIIKVNKFQNKLIIKMLYFFKQMNYQLKMKLYKKIKD